MAAPHMNPVIVFDFEKKTVTIIGPGPKREKTLTEVLAAQAEYVSTSSSHVSTEPKK